MDISITFIRGVFILLCVATGIIFTSTSEPTESHIANLVLGLVGGSAFGGGLVGLGGVVSKFNLRTMNILTLGLLFGYLLGQAITLILSSVIDLSASAGPVGIDSLIKAGIYLATGYLGMFMTARSSEELYVSLPFVRFKTTSLKKKDILLDPSCLQDPRIIDLASSGLIDNHLILPRFAINELYNQNERGDEAARGRARRSLEVLKKLETTPSLALRYTDSDFSECKEPMEKLVRLGRMLDANILTSDVSAIQQASVEDVRIIKFQNLCNALKPLTQTGEYINIKVQRYGKEPRQGVGYLEDGTMVVVNGGAEFISETIRAQVLSVKHTSSGRMIFCNALEGNMDNGCDFTVPEFISEGNEQHSSSYLTI